jgi:hypothetical protein
VQVHPDCIAGMECLLGMTHGYTSSSSSSGKLAARHPAKHAHQHSSNGGSATQHGKLRPDASCSQFSSHCGSVADVRSSRASNGCEAASFIGSRSPGAPAGAKQATSRDNTAVKAVTSAAAGGGSTSGSSAGQASASGAASSASGVAATTVAADQCGSAGLARLLDELRLYPTSAQLHLMDKKFGGELEHQSLLMCMLMQQWDCRECADMPHKYSASICLMHACAWSMSCGLHADACTRCWL